MKHYSLTDDTWDQAEIDAINRVVSSGKFTMGEEVKTFEREFAKFFGVKYAVMSNSGSSANLLMIASLVLSGRLNPGDQIIVPAVSWSTTYYPVTQYGLILKFVDIDIDTLNYDLKQLENSINFKTKAIFVVNLLGNPNDFDVIQDLASKYDLLIIEDNCESLGAKYKGKYTGTFGVLGTFSTFYSHHISTMEGGVTVTNDEVLYSIMLSIRAHGWTRNLTDENPIYQKSPDPFYESYNFILPGYNLRPLEIEAAIGLEQIKKIDNIVSQRRENATYFLSQLKSIPWLKIQKEIGESSWFGFSLILDKASNLKRSEVLKALKDNNIDVRPIVAGNFTRNPVIKYLPHEIFEDLRNADQAHDLGYFVGNHSRNNRHHIDKLVSVLKNL
jgi:CDP-4-dehydro-6-deoxyglucose reductase, E1